MKRLLCILFCTLHSSILILCNAQNPSYQQKLFYTCKVWGFVKYFHSNVSTCGVNWDSVLIADLPLIKNAVTKNDFNNALDTMLNAAGPMALTSTPQCDTIPPELSRNLNTAWLNDTSIFRNDVITILDTINNNFRPHNECWVTIENYPNYLNFGEDTLILNINNHTNYPDEWQRLLEIFAYWNIINYFNPYNYIENQPWDSTLCQNIIAIDTVSNDKSFYTAFLKMTSDMDDSHVEVETYDNYYATPLIGYYSPDIALKYILGKYIVVLSTVAGISKGDEIISVNGLSTKQWEDSLSPYQSVGDSAGFYELIMEGMLLNGTGDTITITYYDSLNTIHVLSTRCTNYLAYSGYYPNDTLAGVRWKYWSTCNIGYINAKNMEDRGSDVAVMYSVLQNTNAIIIDIRNYPASNALWDLAYYYLYPLGSTPFAKFMMPDVSYPGTFYWEYDNASPGNSNPYKGKIIVLFNEQTVSAAEFASMLLGELPNSVKIGSQTDGADGDITFFNLSQDIGTGYSSLGVFYPNGDSTQRVGIIPDILVYPTQEGIRAGRDEVLEKALEVAGCPLSVPELKAKSEEVRVYPNPGDGLFNFQIPNTELRIGNVEVFNVLGEKVYTQFSIQHSIFGVDLSSSPDGVYFYRVVKEDGGLIGEGKLIIQK